MRHRGWEGSAPRLRKLEVRSSPLQQRINRNNAHNKKLACRFIYDWRTINEKCLYYMLMFVLYFTFYIYVQFHNHIKRSSSNSVSVKFVNNARLLSVVLCVTGIHNTPKRKCNLVVVEERNVLKIFFKYKSFNYSRIIISTYLHTYAQVHASNLRAS